MGGGEGKEILLISHSCYCATACITNVANMFLATYKLFFSNRRKSTTRSPEHGIHI